MQCQDIKEMKYLALFCPHDVHFFLRDAFATDHFIDYSNHYCWVFLIAMTNKPGYVKKGISTTIRKDITKHLGL